MRAQTDVIDQHPPAFVDQGVAVYLDECVAVLETIPSGSVDAVVTDPPYAIRVDASRADAFRTDEFGVCLGCGNVEAAHGYNRCSDCLELADREALLHASMLGMQSTNWHEKATHSRGYADNDPVQFQRWCTLWVEECMRVLKPGGHLLVFGGTRTWHRVAVAVEDAGFEIRDSLAWLHASGFPKSVDVGAGLRKRALALADIDGSDVAELPEWEGWGTALKPAHEPIVLARKPLRGTVVGNVAAFGTGALNVRDCRIPTGAGATAGELGKWPSNVLLDESQAECFLEGTGRVASRFFFVAKPDASERVHVEGVSHPTVKPLTLMRELVRLVTPPGGLVLDPFAGSGTTIEACLVEGFNVIGIERDPAYLPLIRQRVLRRRDPVKAVAAASGDQGLFDLF